MHFLQAINCNLSVFIVCNKTGGTIKGDLKKKKGPWRPSVHIHTKVNILLRHLRSPQR